MLVGFACSMAGCQLPGTHTEAGQNATTDRDGDQAGAAADAVAAASAGAEKSPPGPEYQAEPDPREVQALLERAEEAMDAGRLLSAASSSALLLYDRVLNLDPDNESARASRQK
ncbi:MAG: hypothetical protein ACK2U9_24130 [Anaerolineae bacterium]